jgi:hypothetical protein
MNPLPPIQNPASADSPPRYEDIVPSNRHREDAPSRPLSIPSDAAPRPVPLQPGEGDDAGPKKLEALCRSVATSQDPGAHSPPLPWTALYLLGLEEQRQQTNSAWGVDPIDPMSLEFELVCISCFHYRSACTCASGKAMTTVEISSLPLTKSRYGSFLTPSALIEILGMKTAHLAAAITNTFWPVISLGLIPVFDRESLAIVGSPVLDGITNSKEFIRKMSKSVVPSKKQTDCVCGCREVICARVALRHGLYEDSNSFSRAVAINYTIGDQPITVVDLGNGTTCLSCQGVEPLDVDSDFLDDYLVACAWNSKGPVYHFCMAPRSHNRMIQWDAVLGTMVAELISGKAPSRTSFDRTVLRVVSQHPGGQVLVMRTEPFGAGTGLIVLNLEPNALDENRALGNLQIDFQRLGISQLSYPSLSKVQDCTTAPPGDGWDAVSVVGQGSFPQFHSRVVSHGLTMIGNAGRPQRGFRCSKQCRAGVSARCSGFSAPPTDIPETTVYIVGENPVAYLVVSHYAQEYDRALYFVDRHACLGCTVLLAPQGSIVAGVLPSVSIYREPPPHK